MPHWFSYVGSLKLYQPLAGILRFVGLSLVAGDFQFNVLFVISLTVFIFNLDLLVLPLFVAGSLGMTGMVLDSY